jgi:hypothetical protein
MPATKFHAISGATMTFATAICILALCAWFVISALAQLNWAKAKKLKSYDAFSLIPNWSFFAPRPGTSDYHLLFRDTDSSGTAGSWQEIPLAGKRTLSGAIWNPQKRRTKTLSDVVRGLVMLSRDRSLSDYSLTLPYLVILNYVSSLHRAARSGCTQFMILKSEGFYSTQDPQFIFLSKEHRLENAN